MNVQFTDQEVDTLREQWAALVARDNARQDCFGLKLFQRLFDLHPQYKQNFGFKPEEKIASERLRAHGVNVVYMLNMLFDNLDDLEMIDELLWKMVRSHVARGIEAAMFDHIVRPFEEVLRETGLESSNVIHRAFLYIKNRIQELYEEKHDKLASELLDGSDVSDIDF